MPELICFGELLVDFIPLERNKNIRELSGFKPAPGGAPANVAAGFAKLGGKSALISKVGLDIFGHFLIEQLQAAGVETGFIAQTEEAPTGLAFACNNENGENDFVFYRNPSPDMLIREAEVNLKDIKKTSIFHFGSVSMLDSPARESTLLAARTATENNKIVSYDPNLRPALWPNSEQARQAILESLPLTTILKVSLSELHFVIPGKRSKIEQSCQALFDQYPRLKLIAVTEAEKGSTICTRQSITRIKPFPVDFLDPTGAGDAYMAALLYNINHKLVKIDRDRVDWNQPVQFWQEIGCFASAAGALATTGHGAIASMPAYSNVINAVTK